jgi:hypothetical protein
VTHITIPFESNNPAETLQETSAGLVEHSRFTSGYVDRLGDGTGKATTIRDSQDDRPGSG